ncbi:GAF and ANTAR domain-containing protein [uncultured Modestobacter sp.]|uniref:GAF and ANTAR domain-containing protein n=1 Tax=uncultured Modestobacter sp. TaxID=380048 RepID=UPI0026305FB3|nr:GAF and ANTAR domain-containing protein [uncultured Modestobacter sp.]
MSDAPQQMSPVHLVALHANVASRLRGFDRAEDAASAMARTAVDLVHGADWAGLTKVDRRGELTSLGATDPLVKRVDQVQYELHSGPCVDVVLTERTFATGNLGSSPEWPVFGRRAAELGVQSMLSHRVFLDPEEQSAGQQLIGGINLYSRHRDAFDLEQALPVLSVLSTFAALAVWGGSMAEQATAKERALDASRDIGAAMGILIERFKLTREDAFALLSAVSQASNRKLRHIATELVDTGQLALPDLPRRRRPA